MRNWRCTEKRRQIHTLRNRLCQLARYVSPTGASSQKRRILSLRSQFSREIVRLVEIGNESRVARTPSQPFLSLRA